MISTLPNVIAFAFLLLAALQAPQRPEAVTAHPAGPRDQPLAVALPSELQCLGFISDSRLPLDIYISGTEEEGLTSNAMQGSLVYLNGPGLGSRQVGDVLRVARGEGIIRDRRTGERLGIYYKELGTVRIEVLRQEGATGTVLVSCNPIFKGDLLISAPARPSVKHVGDLSNRLTSVNEQGLASSIVLGRNDAREMASGQFCFIGVGARDGVKPGDQFTIYRVQPPFDPKDLIVNNPHSGTTYDRLTYKAEIIETLRHRKIAPRILGDLVVVDVTANTAAARIVNSRSEIHVGDIVFRR